uniref:SH2B adaptor protein 3 n=1 Tax=Gasterosteus aculeatus TaxID=69293 RepID=G3NSJ6_GASAC
MNGNTIHPANTTNTTAARGGGPSVAAPPRGWREFCELHAIATARQLAGHYRIFARERPQHDALPPETFSKQFTDLFQQHFSCEVDKDGALLGQDYREAGRPGGEAAPSGVGSPKLEPVVASREQEQQQQPLGCSAVSQIRQTVWRLFQKRPSPLSSQDLAPSNPNLPTNSPPIPPLVQALRPRPQPPRTCKEGQLRYLLVEDAISDTQPRWQRCRLLVRRIRGGGGERYQLELYDPPKASSPKLTTPCSDIQEVRRCNRLEMPDNLNTFVLKVNQGSLIFETDNDQQVSSWTTELKECINNRSGSVDLEPLPSPADSGAPANRRGSSEPGSQSTATFALPEQVAQKADHFLFSYPWFHGPISRVKAAHLVQSAGPQGHGVFLVRQSETRRGDYVLTFNYQGKAKHLRLSLTEWGQCRVQHLRFPSVMDMLSHFRLFPIPLECGAAGAVTLSSFVVAGSSPPSQGQLSGAHLIPFSLHRWSSEPSLAHCSLARSASQPRSTCPSSTSTSSSPGSVPPPANRPFPRTNRVPDAPLTAAAPLRRSESAGRRPLLPRHPITNIPQRDSDYELEPERGHKRAIDNQYMLV